MQNGYESQTSPFPTVHPTVSADGNVHDMRTQTTIQSDSQGLFMENSFPDPTGNLTSASLISTNRLWEGSLMSPGPSWLVGYDFDLEALNTSVSTTLCATEPLFQSQVNRTAMPSAPQLGEISEAEMHGERKDVTNERVRRGWFSHIDPLDEKDDHGGATTGQMTPVTARDQYDIGDSFRHRISQQLRARTIDEPLPSTKFLRPDTLCLMVLWHTVFMSLVTDFNVLERAVGRNGAENWTLDADLAYATSWATSREAQRCILHAHALLYSLGALRLDAEAAIHIPHCLFLAGIASYCYTRFRRPSSFQAHGHNQTSHLASPDSQLQPTMEFPEFTVRGAPIPQHLFGSPAASTSVGGTFPATDDASNAFSPEEDPTTRFRPTSDVGAAMMCTLIDMLQRIGHWGIARKYAATLSTLVDADSDEDWKFIMSDH
ncbi:hypothetical protein VE03_05217 [Pseudogymnoascus sp. 23342-1-I1]|nr:hypothetical protein VE03_05217 [Pseudogymnoascus sp. 23342-1-I1]